MFTSNPSQRVVQKAAQSRTMFWNTLMVSGLRTPTTGLRRTLLVRQSASGISPLSHESETPTRVTPTIGVRLDVLPTSSARRRAFRKDWVCRAQGSHIGIGEHDRGSLRVGHLRSLQLHGGDGHGHVRDVRAGVFGWPNLKAGQLVVLDNLAPHRSPQVDALIEARGCRVLRLPPYSPDFNPIEMAISKTKSVLRKLARREADALYGGISEAMSSITPQDARNFIRHCKYATSE